MPTTNRLIKFGFAAFFVIFAFAPTVRAEMKSPAHPFILWTKDEATAIRAKMDSQPWMKESWERAKKQNNTFTRLFAYQVMGDEKAGDEELKYLLTFIGAPVDAGRRWADNYLSVLRYDVLYDKLTPEQRKGLEDTFRVHVQYELDHPYENDRTSWLPNMQMPRRLSATIMTLVLGDEALIRKAWAQSSDFKWFMDTYLADGCFYNEEFNKMTSLVGEFLLYSRGLERLGLGELGYDFKGANGGSLRAYVESTIKVGFPRDIIPGGMPRYERVAMGDARGGGLYGIFIQAIVPGVFRDGTGQWPLYYAANMNGRDHTDRKVEKLQFPQWYEINFAKYPDSPCGYFLAQMRGPKDDKYYPTPFWGLDPIDPASVKAPPAPSGVYPERGFAMLRADESPAYWESPAPAVALQFATLYVHYTADCFSLLGYHAFNRPIYVNRAISSGYNGGPWDFNLRGHCGVVVDGLQAQPIGEIPTQSSFTPLAKFVFADGRMAHPDQPYKGKGEVRSSDQPKKAAGEIYPGVQLSRSLVLTREYLFDAYDLRSDTPRQYHWLVHAPGEAKPMDPNQWADSTDLQKTLFNVPQIKITGEKQMTPAGDWSLVTLQTCAAPDASKTVLGSEWFDRQVGVKVWMLAEPDTHAFHFTTPKWYVPGSERGPDAKANFDPPDCGGVSIAVARNTARTTFVALHEPFEHGKTRLDAFNRLAQTKDGVFVSISGVAIGVNDRIAISLLSDRAVEQTLAGDNESITFTGYGFVRIEKDTVRAVGDIKALTLHVEDSPKFILNDKETPATIANGTLTYKYP